MLKRTIRRTILVINQPGGGGGGGGGAEGRDGLGPLSCGSIQLIRSRSWDYILFDLLLRETSDRGVTIERLIV